MEVYGDVPIIDSGPMEFNSWGAGPAMLDARIPIDGCENTLPGEKLLRGEIPAAD
jgi:hypothetical protein